MTEKGSSSTLTRPSDPVGLSHSLLGHDTRRTISGLLALVILLTLIIGNRLSRILTVGGEPLETVTHSNPVTTYLVFSSVTAVIIGLVTAGVLIAPFVYAVWNGGPVISFMIPVAPIVLPDVLLGRYVFDLDWAIAVTVGAAAAALAMYADDARRTGSLQPWSSQMVIQNSDIRLQLVTVFFGGTIISILWFVSGSPEHIVRWYSPFAILLSLPAVIVVIYWARLRAEQAECLGA